MVLPVMNRRSFLKLFGVTAAAVALPAVALEALHPEDVSPERLQLDRWAQFDPKATYGDYVILTDDWNSINREHKLKIFKVIEDNMRLHIPPDHWHKVKYIDKGFGVGGTVDPYNELSTVAWKYTP